MASSLLDFNNSFRSLKYRVEIDKTGAFVDYSDLVDFINVYEKIQDGVTGYISQDCDIRLIVPNFDTTWQKTGLNIKVYVIISSDNWASSYEYLWYEGITENKTTISDKEVNLKTVSILQSLRNSKTIGFGSPATQTFDSLISTFLYINGLPQITNFPTNVTSYSVPFLVGIAGLNQGDAIDEICKACNYTYRYDQGKFTFRQIEYIDRLTIEGYKRTFDLENIIQFSNTANKSLYYNLVTANGRVARYIDFTNFNDYLYCNLQLNSLEVKAGQKLYLVVDDKDLVDYESINAIGGFNPSYFEAYTLDNFTLPFNNTGITTSTFSITLKNNKTKFLVIFNNSNGSSRYIKRLCIKGSGAVQTDFVTYTSTGSEIVTDQQNKELILNSDYITTLTQAQYIATKIIENFNSTKRYFEIIIKGNPDNKVGDIIQIQDRLSNYLNVVIIEIDSEISRDRGFEQTILVKEV